MSFNTAPAPNHIRRFREEFNLSLDQLAHKVGLTTGDMAFMEAGDARPVEEHRAVANALGVNVTDLHSNLQWPVQTALSLAEGASTETDDDVIDKALTHMTRAGIACPQRFRATIFFTSGAGLNVLVDTAAREALMLAVRVIRSSTPSVVVVKTLGQHLFLRVSDIETIRFLPLDSTDPIATLAPFEVMREEPPIAVALRSGRVETPGPVVAAFDDDGKGWNAINQPSDLSNAIHWSLVYNNDRLFEVDIDEPTGSGASQVFFTKAVSGIAVADWHIHRMAWEAWQITQDQGWPELDDELDDAEDAPA